MESKEDAAVERQKLVPDDAENDPDDDGMLQMPPPIIAASAAAVAAAAAANVSSSLPGSGKTQQTPISPVLSHKIFSSGETSRTQDSSNCSVGGGRCGGGGGTGGAGTDAHNSAGVGSGGVGGGSSIHKQFGGGEHGAQTRVLYVNERTGSGSSKHQQDAKQQHQQQLDYKAKARRIQRDDEDAITPASTSASHQSLASSLKSQHSNQNAITTTMGPPLPLAPAATHTIVNILSSPSLSSEGTQLPQPPSNTPTHETTTVTAHIHQAHTSAANPLPSTKDPHAINTQPKVVGRSSGGSSVGIASGTTAPMAMASTSPFTATAGFSSAGVPVTMKKQESMVAGSSGTYNTAPAAAVVASASGTSFDQRQLKHHSFVSEVPDVRHMERALLGLLEDFHLGKLKAFGSGCTMDQMTDIREQQESLAKLHFELGAGGDPLNVGGSLGGGGGGAANAGLNAQENMTQLVARLENLSVSIEKLHSSNTNL